MQNSETSIHSFQSVL